MLILFWSDINPQHCKENGVVTEIEIRRLQWNQSVARRDPGGTGFWNATRASASRIGTHEPGRRDIAQSGGHQCRFRWSSVATGTHKTEIRKHPEKVDKPAVPPWPVVVPKDADHRSLRQEANAVDQRRNVVGAGWVGWIDPDHDLVFSVVDQRCPGDRHCRTLWVCLGVDFSGKELFRQFQWIAPYRQNARHPGMAVARALDTV